MIGKPSPTSRATPDSWSPGDVRSEARAGTTHPMSATAGSTRFTTPTRGPTGSAPGTTPGPALMVAEPACTVLMEGRA